MKDAGCKFCRALGQYDAAAMGRDGASSGLWVADLPTSVAVLSIDQYYRGYTVLIAKNHATELYHLTEEESVEFVRDMRQVAHAIAKAFTPRKMNYELLGNTVPHLHWHLVPRYDWDEKPKRPIWEHDHEQVMLDTAEYEAIANAIRAHLA